MVINIPTVEKSFPHVPEESYLVVQLYRLSSSHCLGNGCASGVGWWRENSVKNSNEFTVMHGGRGIKPRGDGERQRGFSNVLFFSRYSTHSSPRNERRMVMTIIIIIYESRFHPFATDSSKKPWSYTVDENGKRLLAEFYI